MDQQKRKLLEEKIRIQDIQNRRLVLKLQVRREEESIVSWGYNWKSQSRSWLLSLLSPAPHSFVTNPNYFDWIQTCFLQLALVPKLLHGSARSLFLLTKPWFSFLGIRGSNEGLRHSGTEYHRGFVHGQREAVHSKCHERVVLVALFFHGIPVGSNSGFAPVLHIFLHQGRAFAYSWFGILSTLSQLLTRLHGRRLRGTCVEWRPHAFITSPFSPGRH